MRDRQDKDAITLAIFTALLLMVGLTVASALLLWAVTALFAVPVSVSGPLFVAVELVVLFFVLRFLLQQGRQLRR